MCKATLEFYGKCKLSKLLSKSNQTGNGSPSSPFNHKMFPLVPIKAEALAVCMHDSLMRSLIYSIESKALEQLQ